MEQAERSALPLEQHRKGRRPTVAVQDGMRKIVELCDREPHGLEKLAAAVGRDKPAVSHWLERMRAEGVLVFSRSPDVRGWMTPRLWRRLLPGVCVPGASVPAANVPLRPRWESGQVVVEHRKGVKITRAEPPRQRWATDVKPGQGVISGDWMMRRQGGEAPTGWTAGWLDTRAQA